MAFGCSWQTQYVMIKKLLEAKIKILKIFLARHQVDPRKNGDTFETNQFDSKCKPNTYLFIVSCC